MAINTPGCGITFLIIPLVLLFFFSPASAVPSVSNIKLLTDAAPGEVITYPITISSDAGDSPTDVYIDVMGFGQALDMAYTPLPAASDASPSSARPLISLDKTSVNLPPGSSVDVTATITIPRDAQGGGRYAIISIHTGSDTQTTVQSYSVAYQIPVMITVTGSPPQEKGSITDISATLYQTGGPVFILTRFQNTGNHHYYNTVNSVRVLDGSGKTVADTTLSPTLFAIVPTSTVQYIADLKKTLPAGSYTIISTVSLEGGTVLDEKRSPLTIGDAGLPLYTAEAVQATPMPTSGSLQNIDQGVVAPNEQGASLSQAPSGSQDFGVNIPFYSGQQSQTGSSGSDYGTSAGGSQQLPEQTWEQRSITLTPRDRGYLETSSKQVSITVPEGSVIGTVDMTVQPVSRTQLSAPPGNYRIAGTTFRVEGLTGLLAKDATIVVRYNQADRDAAGGDPSRLVLARWDDANGQWTLLPTTVDLNAGTLTVTTSHMSSWAVMAPSGPVAARTTYAPGPDPGTVCGLLGLIVAVTGALSRKW